jgi:hypothetical protein
VFPVKYELGVYIPEDDILHSHRCENLKSYMVLICLVVYLHHINMSYSVKIFARDRAIEIRRVEGKRRN